MLRKAHYYSRNDASRKGIKMIDENGWIKLWRKSINSGLMRNPHLWTFWCWCLMKATHKEIKQRVGFQEISLLPGQFIFGRKSAAEELAFGEQTIRTCMGALKSTSNLTIKVTSKFSIVTISNWSTYQNGLNETNQQSNHQTNQPLTSNQPATNQQLTTNKNDKNNKNEKNNQPEAGLFEDLMSDQFSDEYRDVMSEWEKARKSSGLSFVNDRRTQSGAARIARMVRVGEITTNNVRRAMSNLLLDSDARINYTLDGLSNNISTWIDRTPNSKKTKTRSTNI